MGKRLWLVMVLVVALLCVAGCGNDDVNVVEPERLERVEPTSTPISVGADDADQLIQDVRDGREAVDEGLDLVNELNCKLGFSSCITESLGYDEVLDLDLWEVDSD